MATPVLRHMTNLHIGERVTFDAHAYFVRGFSPMGVPARRVYLEDAATGDRVEASIDDIHEETRYETPLGAPRAGRGSPTLK